MRTRPPWTHRSSPLQLSSVTPATPVIFIVQLADVVTKLLVPLPVKQVWPPRGRVLGETLVTTECALLPQSSNVIARALVLTVLSLSAIEVEKAMEVEKARDCERGSHERQQERG